MSNLIDDSSNPLVAAISGKHTSQGIGVQAESAEKWAIRANAPRDTAIFATSGIGRGIDVRSTSGIGIYAEGNVAGHFQGNVVVTGDIKLPNADCAEEFDVFAPTEIEPGMLIVS